MAVAGRFGRTPRRERPRRVLLAWEYGAGRTHYSNLLAVASHLRASGIDCLAALYDNSAADREFAAIGVRTIQNYVWPSQRAGQSGWQGNRINGLTDFVADVGLKSGTAVASAIAHYDGIFSLFEPDLVLCEQAWGAVLAAREHLPVVAMGFCVRLPPIVDGGFPIFPGRPGPAFPVDALLAAINEGLAVAGRFPLSEIGDLLRIAAVMPSGPAEFDFYGDLRSEPVLPPSVPGLRDAFPDKPGDEVFVYLHGLVQDHPRVIEALAALDLPVRAYIPNLTAETRAKLAPLILEDRPVPVKDIFANARCVLHQGGEQLASACLAVGVPQVVLSTWLDTRVTGGFVKARGFGDTCRIAEATTEWVLQAVRTAYGDAELHARCRAAAPGFRTWFDVDPTAIVARRICDLLGVPFRAATAAAIADQSLP
jgi:UDP:flavonoid glycosyltransferase YjiC (YdhE family)